MGKRAFDLLLASVGLVVVAPLLLAAMLWIRLDSPGPALFRQQRVGRHGRLFRIHKLRTMHVAPAAPERAAAITAHEDPRVTRAGHWLRHYRIDELPQLIDVIAGHMSLVGPRPEVPRFVALYPPELRAELLSVRPGITDPASLAFADEAELLAGSADTEQAYVERILPLKLRQQVEYLRRATWRSDLGVLARTLRMLSAR
ncbi:MAG: sugar transferase [Ideonella sp.]|nr:sugar transferase [Ideonella sp.]MCC7456881.1 sugar transferase [Nitrospira sp.]